MAATVADVRKHLGLDPATTTDEETLAEDVAAANDFVSNLREDWTATEPWRPMAQKSAVLQAARLYARRGSVIGVATYADVGMTMFPRVDPDIAAMLELGNYQRSVVA